MKYIKTYENSWIDDPQVGKYYLIKNGFMNFFTQFFDSPYTKIVDINRTSNKYTCLTTNNKTLFFHEDMFERELTSEEIEQYELELKSNNYNL